MLAVELADLEKEGLDLTLVGFSEDELRDLLAEETDGPAANLDDKIHPVPVNPITRPGDLWTNRRGSRLDRSQWTQRVRAQRPVWALAPIGMFLSAVLGLATFIHRDATFP